MGCMNMFYKMPPEYILFHAFLDFRWFHVKVEINFGLIEECFLSHFNAQGYEVQ